MTVISSILRFGILLGWLLALLTNLPAKPVYMQNDAAVVKRWVKPAYPPIAAARKVDGTVLVDVLVNTDGSVQKATVVSGPSLLRKAAKEAAARWLFDSVEGGGSMRSARLIFIFRPLTYVPSEDEPDFTPPYQVAVIRVAVTGSRHE